MRKSHSITVKDSDYLKPDENLTDKLVEEFSAAVHGRRLYAFGGVMKEAVKRLNISTSDEIKQGEVTDKNSVVLRKDIDYILLLYRWNIGLTRYDLDGKL